MSIRILFFLLITASWYNEKQQQSAAGKTYVISNNEKKIFLKKISNQFDSINTLIRDNKINHSEALEQIQRIIPKIKVAYYKEGGKDWSQQTWIFPLQGYSFKAIGGKNGNGYISQRYNYFDGDKHKGHPAQDIFILDKNQDCKDDNTGKPVNVLSLSGGIVVAIEKNWDTTSSLRGGKYIWIYDPTSNSLFYYAHNSNLQVNTGQIIKPGDIISTVGRSGFNAFKKRSPTHLHVLYKCHLFFIFRIVSIMLISKLKSNLWQTHLL